MSNEFPRYDSARVFAIGGALLVAFGMLVGEIYAIYISHVLNGLIGANWVGVIEAVGLSDLEQMRGHFAIIEDLAAKRGRTMHSHSHLGAFGLLALVLALLQRYVALQPRARLWLALVYIAGALLQVLGLYASYYAGTAFLYVSNTGAVFLIGAIGGTLWGLRNINDFLQEKCNFVLEQVREPASRYLIKAGVLLILLGMTFGLYYAWQLVNTDEPAVYSAMQSVATEMSNGDLTNATSEIRRFKQGQSKIAITAAAHSHAIEFGFLMLLLAFIQRFVMLSEGWRLRWARVFSVGAFTLPVCVYLATKYGLRAAAFSDLFGSVALVALAAMIFGMIRHTGALDSAREDDPR